MKTANRLMDEYRNQVRVDGKAVEEQSGFYPNMNVVMPSDYIPVDHYFNMLFKVQDLLKTAVQKSSGDTKLHYEYMLYKIRKLLDKK